ncbi:J domain-containing protein [Sorangium atrum]|uniref:DnaJ domain-containing protein n=1 Tax=Sorangium atrum TaxID=2995308 RepID=A0ABT5CFE2_9BACT|nr:DnaJ domain-containing protein [Sorangium aterium]MDC0685140.1 DnaJ domain-containing protein [Sorangium aterium]
MTLRVPRPKPGYDLKSLPLKPAEAFLLSRIDGVLTDRDLSLITGMSHGDTVEALRRLRDLGAILLDGEPSGQPPPRDAARRTAAVDPEKTMPSGSEATPLGRDALQHMESLPLYDPAELDEPVELAPDRKRRILDLYYRLEDLSYYALLGVADQADKKQIKSAYYQLAPEFHPDTYFRKQLGSYKPKIEAIFTRITLAHDTLTSKQRRAEYDAYLEQTHKNRTMAALIEQTPRDIATITTAVDATVRAAFADPRDMGASPGRYSSERAPAEQGASAASSGAAAPVQPSPAQPPAGASPDNGGAPARSAAPTTPVAPAPTAKDRRETFARKLTGGLRRHPPGAPSASAAAASGAAPAPAAATAAPRAAAAPVGPGTAAAPAAAPRAAAAPAVATAAPGTAVAPTAAAGAPAAPPKTPSGVRSPESMRAVEALKARYENARNDALRSQIARYSEVARAALERSEFASAANAYRIAASLAPEDAELQRASAEVERLAAVALADGYLKQAEYEAQNGRWVDAALSYVKVCNGRPDDAGAHERVAYATLQAGESTRRAVEFARRAVELVPASVEYRLTLALSYAAAGLAKSAAGELERAAELAGNDGRLRGLVAQAREQAKQQGKQV